MVISYRAVYSLLDKFYIRRSLQGFINDYIGADIFNSSILFAHELEDYQYLDVMVTKREYISNKYVFFVRDAELPLVIETEKDFSLYEFALLCQKANCIHLEEFKGVVHDIALRLGLNPDDKMKELEGLVQEITKQTIDKKKGK